MTTRTKIDVHVGALSMEFGDNLVQFNIFEAMKHPTKDLHSLVLIAEFSNFAKNRDVIGYLGFILDEFDYDELLEVQDLSDSDDDTVDLANLDLNFELFNLIDWVCKNNEEPKCSKHARVQVVETEKTLQAQVVAIITIESDSANQGRD
ncbi:hypothetical protein CR513_28983, partial [Mucuna pruriens]